MKQETIFPFKLGLTKEVLTARSGLALFAEYNHGIGLKGLGLVRDTCRQKRGRFY